MALIKCPECNKEISDKAKMCIHCGYPLTNTSYSDETENTNAGNKNTITIDEESIRQRQFQNEKNPLEDKKQPIMYDNKKTVSKTKITVLLILFCLLIGAIGLAISYHNSRTANSDIERTRAALQPYLAQLGTDYGDRGKETEITMNASSEFIEGMDKVFIMGKIGTVSHAFSGESTQIDILDWASNTTESYDSFKSYIEKLCNYFGKKYDVRSYPDNIDLAEENYVWEDAENKYLIITFYKNDKINIRWYYGERFFQEPASNSNAAYNSSINNNATQKPSSTTHKCIVSGCGKDCSYTITGLSGKTEYYCYEHYKEMQDKLEYMKNKTSGSTSSKYDGYSETYKNDPEYRNDVKSIADVYGISEKEVDSKINAVTGGQ